MKSTPTSTFLTRKSSRIAPVRWPLRRIENLKTKRRSSTIPVLDIASISWITIVMFICGLACKNIIAAIFFGEEDTTIVKRKLFHGICGIQTWTAPKQFAYIMQLKWIKACGLFSDTLLKYLGLAFVGFFVYCSATKTRQFSCQIRTHPDSCFNIATFL